MRPVRIIRLCRLEQYRSTQQQQVFLRCAPGGMRALGATMVLLLTANAHAMRADWSSLLL